MECVQPTGLFLCGDVMTGRGIDQVLAHPSGPELFESYIRDARDYVQLAESANGPIPRPVDGAYLWGEALAELRGAGVDARIINLETAITRSAEPWPGKAIHYRMHPGNIGCITAGGVDCCCLANNHVLDWGYAGLAETLRSLDAAQVAHAGAGRNAAEAAAPAVLEAAGKGRILVFALGSTTSGIPPEWGAQADRAGVNACAEAHPADLSEPTGLSQRAAAQIAGQIRQAKRPGDVVVASIHWGANWGYDIPDQQVALAHRLIDAGVDVIHGHSSHHIKGIEIYQGRLVLYGCGDFLDDYEGIGGHEEYRSDLRLMYLPKIDAPSGRLVEMRLVPLQVKRFRLVRASAADARWLGDLLNRLSKPFATPALAECQSGLVLSSSSLPT